MLYIQLNRRTLGRVSKPAVQLEEELETTDDDDDEDLILCRYNTMGTGSEYILCEIVLPRGTGISYWYMNWAF